MARYLLYNISSKKISPKTHLSPHKPHVSTKKVIKINIKKLFLKIATADLKVWHGICIITSESGL